MGASNFVFSVAATQLIKVVGRRPVLFWG